MNCPECTHRINTASRASLLDHFRNAAASFDPPLHAYVDMELYAEKIIAHGVTFESWDGGVLAGVVACYFNDEASKVGFITHVSVLTKYQGAGIASRLLADAIAYGRQAGFTRIDLELGTDNAKARSLYEQYGFIVSRRKTDTTLTMSLTLSPVAP